MLFEFFSRAIHGPRLSVRKSEKHHEADSSDAVAHKKPYSLRGRYEHGGFDFKAGEDPKRCVVEQKQL